MSEIPELKSEELDEKVEEEFLPKDSAELDLNLRPHKSHLELLVNKIRSFLEKHKTVKIKNMEINLTAIWESITTPFVFLFGLLAGKRKARSRRRKKFDPKANLKKAQLMRLGALGSLGLVVFGMISFFILFAWYSRDLPQIGEIELKEDANTKIYDRNAELIQDLFSDQRREYVSLDKISKEMQQAMVSAEDKNFYDNKIAVVFDLTTPFKIVKGLFTHGKIIGTSGLTQQLVKNKLLSSERSISRKIKENFLAIRTEQKYSKDEILEMYLNEVPFGGTSWGVESAAQVYFDKHASELNLVESAILAGLPQRPSAYSPFAARTSEDGELLWKIRATYVLARMKEDKKITNLEYESAISDLETVGFAKKEISVRAPHFTFYVRDQLEEMLGVEVVEAGGFQVTTTLDLELQEEAQKIVTDEIEDVKDLDISNGAALIMEPSTGEILGMVGSADYFDDEIGGQFNVAVDALRQPGSSIKPVTYLGLIQRGYTPAFVFSDVETTFTPNETAENPYTPQNYNGKFNGPVSLRQSLGSSLNVSAVKALAYLGIDNFLNLAYDMGFETLAPTEENFKRFGLALTLGGGEVHLIDTVSAYSVFANGGRRIDPVSILKVEGKNGKVLYEHKSVEGKRVINEEESFLMNHILSDDSARLLAFGAHSMLDTGRSIAVKTGTTNDQRDNWTIGWSQNFIVGTWVGNNDNSPMKRVASGVTGASPIWRKIVNIMIKQGYKVPDWEIPEAVEQIELDKISGYPSHDGFEVKTEYIIRGTLPKLPDPIHSKLKLCRGENKLATDARIAGGDYDEKEFVSLHEDDPVSLDGKNRWQEAINAWIDAQEDSKYKIPTEYCGENTEIYVKLDRPENEKKYDTEDIEIKIRSDSGEGIEKVELYVNGSLKETINNRNYDGKIHLSRGRYELYAKAYSRSGKQQESNKVRIGTGGEDWKEPEPTPTPTAEPTPTPTPEATPAPTAEPTVEPTPES